MVQLTYKFTVKRAHSYVPRKLCNKLIACCTSALSERERNTGAFIVHKSWTTVFNTRERCTSTLTYMRALRVLSKDMAIAMKLLTFAVPKNDNVLFDWRML